MTGPDFDYESLNAFAPWRPFWAFAKGLVVCFATLVVSIGLGFLLQSLGVNPTAFMVIATFALLGAAFCGFLAVISLWMGALTKCPKCGDLFAGQYFAAKCRNCGATIDELAGRTTK